MREFAAYRRFEQLDALHAHYLTHEFARHTHETYALGVVLSGAEAFWLGGGLQQAPAGSIVLVHPGEAHTGYAPTKQGWEYRMLYPDVAWMQQIAAEVGLPAGQVPVLPGPVIWDPRCFALLERAHRGLWENGPGSLASSSLLIEAIGTLLARHTKGLRPDQKTSARAPLERALRHLQDNLSRPVALEALSAVSGLSRFQLVRAFRQHTGLPPHLYQLQLRVEKAKQILRTVQPLAEVALEAGFSDQAHFTRAFKRVVGVTPGAYRLAVR